MELRKLEVQTPDRGPDLWRRSEIRKRVEGLASDNECLEMLAHSVILHQQFVGLQHLLNGVHAARWHALEGGPAWLFGSCGPKQFHKLLLTTRNLVLRRRVGCGLPSRGAKIVLAAVENIQLFADRSNALKTG